MGKGKKIVRRKKGRNVVENTSKADMLKKKKNEMEEQ
jgi:hypothetical protein